MLVQLLNRSRSRRSSDFLLIRKKPVPVARNRGNIFFDSPHRTANTGRQSGKEIARIQPRVGHDLLRLKRHSYCPTVSQHGTENRTVVCRYTGDLDVGLASDHDLDRLSAERQFSWLARH